MSPGPLRAFALYGAEAAAALDWLLVRCESAGVLEEPEAIVVWLAGALPALPFDRLTVVERPVVAADYTITGLEHDAPILVADDLLVRPPWVPRPEGFVGVELIVPRGGAFGSGEHDSTQAALLAVHAVWNAPASFADVGTGTGILALYAAARGARSIVACDIDASSVRAARELLPSAEVRLGGPEVLPPSDFVVANMTGDELVAASTALLTLWTQRAPLVLGGMRAHEVAGIERIVPGDVVHRVTVGAFTALAFAASRSPGDPRSPGDQRVR